MINFGFKASLLAVALSSISVAPVEAISVEGVGKAVVVYLGGRLFVSALKETVSITAIIHPRKMLLRKAILDSNVALAKLVLAAGVDASVIPLIEETESGHSSWLSGWSISALGMAVCRQDKNIVKVLLDAGVDVNQVVLTRGDFLFCVPSSTALACAALASGQCGIEIIKMLLDAGAKLDTCTLYEGNTLINLAGDSEIRAFLLAKKAEQEAIIDAVTK